MFKSLLFVSSLLIGSLAFAEGDHTHTPNVCAAQNTAVCAHLGLHKALKSTEEGQFIVDIMTPGKVPYTNLKVELWMPDMGHGSAPVVLKDMGNNHHLVTNAWFMMTGAWLVRLNFDFEGQNLDIEIPLEIAE